MPQVRIDKNARNVLYVAIPAILLVVILLLWIYGPRTARPLPTIECADGRRPLIDATQFATQYTGYSVKLEATLSDKAKLGAELKPQQWQQLSEAMQQANEFRKWIVNSYNACAISGKAYERYGTRFQFMDNVARNIGELVRKENRTNEERAQLSRLVDEYIRLSGGLARAAENK